MQCRKPNSFNPPSLEKGKQNTELDKKYVTCMFFFVKVKMVKNIKFVVKFFYDKGYVEFEK